LDIKVSQGSVATSWRGYGILNDHCVTQSMLSLKVREFENRSTFAEVMGRIKVGVFFWTQCR